MRSTGAIRLSTVDTAEHGNESVIDTSPRIRCVNNAKRKIE